MQLVTGYTGVKHVSAQDDSIRNVMLGEFNGKGVFPVFEEFEAVAVTANEVRVRSGYGINQGRLFKIDRNDYDSCTIENGAAGLKRVDLIVARYLKDEQTGIESCELVVIKGTPSAEGYVDPTYTVGNLLTGALQDDMPMYRVKINGVAIEAVESMFETYRSLIGGVEKVIDQMVDDNFDDKMAANQARFDQMINSDHNAYTNQKNSDHTAYTNQKNADHQAYQTMMEENDDAFDAWFAQVQAYLDEETATKLANAVASHNTALKQMTGYGTDAAGNVNSLGVLPANKGGTGQTNAKSAFNSLAYATDTSSNGPSDDNVFLVGVNNAFTRRPFSAIWNTIAGKIRSTFGFGSTNVLSVANGGTGNTSGRITIGQKPDSSIGTNATSEGENTVASGQYSHAEGSNTTASGMYSHAEGHNTESENNCTHAEGESTLALGVCSHAEGTHTEAGGASSHAEGYYTIANGANQHVAGKFNQVDYDRVYAVIIGNGTATNNRSNAMTLDWSGNLKATSYANLSSKKYKKNIKNMTDDEAKKILELNPVKYDYKSELLPNNQYGLIAEEVENIMPYVVIYEDGVADAIDYSKFVPALIKIVQIQQKEIDELKENFDR